MPAKAAAFQHGDQHAALFLPTGQMRQQGICFTPNAVEEYTAWRTEDRAILKRIHQLLDAICRDPFAGIGRPEPPRHRPSGFWSRQINEEHRLVYKLEGETLTVVQCRYHY